MSDKNVNEFENGNGYNNGRGGQGGPGGQGGQGGQGGPGGNGSNPRKVNLLLLLVAALITLVLTSVFMRTLSNSETKEISYSEFMEWVDAGRVEGQPNTVVASVHYGLLYHRGQDHLLYGHGGG